MDESKRLRVLLDESGIEHKDNDTPINGVTSYMTTWHCTNGKLVSFIETEIPHATKLRIYNPTPEQAIAATVEYREQDEWDEWLEDHNGVHEWHSPRAHPPKVIELHFSDGITRFVPEDAATVRTEPDEATMLKLHSRMNAVLLDMNEEMLAYHSWDRENASSKELIDCVIAAHQIIEDAATVGVGTCTIVKTWTDSDYADHWRYSCSECGYQIEVGERDVATGNPTSHANFCWNCGRRCIGIKEVAE